MGSIGPPQCLSLKCKIMAHNPFANHLQVCNFSPHLMAINIKYSNHTLFILFYSCMNFKSILKRCSARDGNELLRAIKKGQIKEEINQRY